MEARWHISVIYDTHIYKLGHHWSDNGLAPVSWINVDFYQSDLQERTEFRVRTAATFCRRHLQNVGHFVQSSCWWICAKMKFNSLAPRWSGCNFKSVIFTLVLLIGIFKSSYDNAISWMPQDFTDDESTLVQVMAWCRQATSHYLSQCWPRSVASSGHNELT